jgi:type IV pilus assembly protein PilA
MKNVFMRFRQSGQGMTEYIVIVALVAVGSIGVYQLFGSTVRSQTAAISQEVAGKSGAAAVTQAGTAADKAVTAAAANKNTLSTYTDQNAVAGAAQ